MKKTSLSSRLCPVHGAVHGPLQRVHTLGAASFFVFDILPILLILKAYIDHIFFVLSL